MEIIPDVGERCKLASFAFNNKGGGTGLSDWLHDERFAGVAEVKCTKKWYDYETGWRYHGQPVSPDLLDYLGRNSAKDVVYFGLHEVLEVEGAPVPSPLPHAPAA
jgi:hypothetical protein